MPSRNELREYYNIGAQLAPVVHQQDDWPYEVGHQQYVTYLVPPHDVGGQADVPVRYEEKEEELWELNTYVTCEVLGWRGVWNAEERRRRGNNDLVHRCTTDSPTTGAGSGPRRECWSTRTLSRSPSCSRKLRK